MPENARDQLDLDMELMGHAREGSVRAFTSLYVQYLPIITEYLRRGAGPGAPVEDLAQDVFLAIWRNWQSFRGDSTFVPYAFGIAKNILRQHHRKVHRETNAIRRAGILSNPDSRTSKPEACVLIQELGKAVGRAQSRLPEKQYQALELILASNLSAKDAAKQAGCSYDAFRQRVHDARESLRWLLKDFCEF
ncbi:MAG: RNA polymerase sigma factor [Planctomycetota bacterium]|jgi:RNA polymerase sigma-70 factor (ECF subfamily)